YAVCGLSRGRRIRRGCARAGQTKDHRRPDVMVIDADLRAPKSAFAEPAYVTAWWRRAYRTPTTNPCRAKKSRCRAKQEQASPFLARRRRTPTLVLLFLVLFRRFRPPLRGRQTLKTLK